MATEKTVLLGFLLEEAVDERVETCWVEVEVKHLRVYDALLGLNLLYGVDKVQLCEVRLRLLCFLHFFDSNVVASEEIEGRSQRTEILALIGIIC